MGKKDAQVNQGSSVDIYRKQIGKDNNKKSKKDVKEAKKKSDLKKSAMPIKIAAEQQQSGTMGFDMKVRTKQRCVIEFLHAEKIAPIDIHRRLLNVYGDQTMDVSTVRRWVMRFSNGDSDVTDKPRSGRPCTAVNPQNKERLDQLIRANQQITTRELCTELNVGFNALETMLATLGYRKVCARWVPRVLTQEQKDHQMQVCEDLLNHYSDSFLDRIITGDETLSRHYEPESKQQSADTYKNDM